ncbi:MAG: flagellar hook-associated protein FlgL [Burkholderiales bacterium]
MRLSTSLIFTAGYDAIARQQADLFRTQQQVATGKRIVTPADDPVGAARAQALTASIHEGERYSANIQAANSALEQNDSLLGQVSDLLQRVRTLAVNGGSGALSEADRTTIATEIEGEAQQLFALANSRDAAGKYLFAGNAIDTQPFAQGGTGVVYNGDQGQHQLQVAASRTLPVNLDGSSVFMAGRNGDGYVVARATAGNAGTGVIAPASQSGSMNGHTYTLAFNNPPTDYTLTEKDALGNTVATTPGVPYTSGTAISYGGMQTTITGAPAAGDSFTLGPSHAQDLFATLSNLVATLKTPAVASGARTQVANGIAAALQDLDQGIENIVTLRATTGAQMSELDTLTNATAARSIQDQDSLSGIVDVDYNKALSDFSRQQVALQAAQQSFVKVNGLSLFDYLKL